MDGVMKCGSERIEEERESIDEKGKRTSSRRMKDNTSFMRWHAFVHLTCWQGRDLARYIITTYN